MIARIRNIVRGQHGGAVLGAAGLLAAAATAALVLALVVGDTSAPAADAGRRGAACDPLGLEQATSIYPIADGSYGFSVYGVGQKVMLSNATNTSFDWASSVGIDAVIVKSWFSGNLYTYDEALADTGLKTNKFMQAIFCIDTEPNDEPPPPTEARGETPPTAEPQKCTNRKGCPTPGITPGTGTGKCTDRKGCPTPTPAPIE